MIDATRKKSATPEELQQQIDSINAWIKNKDANPVLVDHFHDGYDTSKIEFGNIQNAVFYVSHTIYGTDAATATNYGVFLIVPIACVVTGIQEVHQTAGSDAGAVTLNIEKLQSTDALDAGDEILASDLSLKATANTVQTGTLSGTLANRSLAAGDRLAMKDAGTLTAVANVTVKIELTVV